MDMDSQEIQHSKWSGGSRLLEKYFVYGMLLLVLLLSYDRLIPEPAVLHYPAGWPFSYLQVPHDARSGEFSMASQWDQPGGARIVPWKEYNSQGHPNRVRSYSVAFRYAGNMEEASAELESGMHRAGWIRSASSDAGNMLYISGDYRYFVNLISPRLNDKGRPLTDWQLSVHEYENPAGYFPEARGDKLP